MFPPAVSPAFCARREDRCSPFVETARPCLCVAINGVRVGWRPHDTYVCVIYTRGVGAAVALCPV